MVQASDLSISPGEDAETVTVQTTALVDHGRWRLCNDGKGLERGFKFKTFKTTWDYMNAVAAECKKAKHHPEWTNVYNRVHVRWTTHSPEGLSTKDTGMAGFCDRVGEEFGEVIEEAKDGEVGTGESGEGARADWRREAKDCCGPKR